MTTTSPTGTGETRPSGPSTGHPTREGGGMTTQDWRQLAACAGTDPEAFFPSSDKQPDRLVLRICRGCPVRVECLESAMASESGGKSSRHGIWGGLTPRQRYQLHRCRTGSCRHASLDACRQAAPWPEVVAPC